MTRDEIQAEALVHLADLPKAAVEISMGVGKCVLSWKHMSKFYTDVSSYLVAAPRRSIFQSWLDDARDYGFEYLLDHTEFVTYRSLNKKDPRAYDVVYLDECHSLKYTHKEWLEAFEANGGKIIGLTGTYPNRKSTEKGEMCNQFCPKVYEYHTDDAVDDSILNDYRIYVHKLYLNGAPTIPVKMRNGGEFMTSEVRNYQYWGDRLDNATTAKQEQIARIQRMKALQAMPSKVEYAKRLLSMQTTKTLVFANTKAQADELCQHRVYSGMPKGVAEGNLEAFKSDNITKLSAVDQLSEGVTVPRLKTGIILHSYANNRKASQKIGRFLRLNPDEVATIHILCYMNTVDEEWVKSALVNFDDSKITWVHPIP